MYNYVYKYISEMLEKEVQYLFLKGAVLSLFDNEIHKNSYAFLNFFESHFITSHDKNNNLPITCFISSCSFAPLKIIKPRKMMGKRAVRHGKKLIARQASWDSIRRSSRFVERKEKETMKERFLIAFLISCPTVANRPFVSLCAMPNHLFPGGPRIN